MARKPRWNKPGAVDGVGVITLSSWRWFHEFIYQEMLDFKTYIWRGQRCDDWLLTPSLERLLRRVRRRDTAARRNSHLEAFKFAARGRRGSVRNPLDSENDWWALGQHQGLATPLLDWTRSPFAAAYFAFIERGSPQTQFRAIFALSQEAVEQKVFENYLGQGGAKNRLGIEFVRPLSDDIPRLVNQDGLFTHAPAGEDIESWVKRNFPGFAKHVLIKFLVPNDDREYCLRSLNRMNINHLTLFPDLYGSSVYCNLDLEIDNY